MCADTFRPTKANTKCTMNRNIWMPELNATYVASGWCFFFGVHLKFELTLLRNVCVFFVFFSCFFRYKNKNRIRNHMRDLHINKPTPVKCDICGKICPNKYAAWGHKTTHKEGYRSKFKCIICGKGFVNGQKMRVTTAKKNTLSLFFFLFHNLIGLR